LYVLRVLDDFDTNCETALVSSAVEYFISCFAGKDISYHAVGVAVSELNGEGFKGMAFRDVVLDSFLKFFACEASST
jgi:hypothetical protein